MGVNVIGSRDPLQPVEQYQIKVQGKPEEKRGTRVGP